MIAESTSVPSVINVEFNIKYFSAYTLSDVLLSPILAFSQPNYITYKFTKNPTLDI